MAAEEAAADVAVEAAVVEAEVAVEDAGDKATVDEEKTNEIKTRYYDFVKSFRDCFCDR